MMARGTGLLVLALAAAACRERPAAQQQAAQAPALDTAPAVPAEPRPSVAWLAVSPGVATFDAVGDTVRLSTAVPAQCQSANDAVAAVEPGGLVRSRGNGETHIRCWAPGAVGRMTVRIAQQIRRVAIVAEQGLTMRQAGDSVRLTLARVDRLGTPVQTVRPTWASLQPDLAQVDSVSGVARAVAATGSARIVASVDGFSDTVMVEMGVKAEASQNLLATRRTAASRRPVRTAVRAAAGRQPTLTPRGAPAPEIVRRSSSAPIAARQPTEADSLFRTPLQAAAAARRSTLTVSAIASLSEHHVTLNGSDTTVESQSGLMIGGAVDYQTGSWLTVHAQMTSGKLTADSSIARDQTVTDAQLDVGVQAFPWLTFIGGFGGRAYHDIALQRWIFVRAGGEARFGLGGGPLSGVLRLMLLPVISAGQNQTAPSFGMISTVGLQYESGKLSSGLQYVVERYGFSGGDPRLEQFGALQFRLGLRFGR